MEGTIGLCDLLDMIFAEVQSSHDVHCDGLNRLIEKGLIIRDSAGRWLLTELGIKAAPTTQMVIGQCSHSTGAPAGPCTGGLWRSARRDRRSRAQDPLLRV